MFMLVFTLVISFLQYKIMTMYFYVFLIVYHKGKKGKCSFLTQLTDIIINIQS